MYPYNSSLLLRCLLNVKNGPQVHKQKHKQEISSFSFFMVLDAAQPNVYQGRPSTLESSKSVHIPCRLFLTVSSGF